MFSTVAILLFCPNNNYLKFQSSECAPVSKKLTIFLLTCLCKIFLKSKCLHGFSKFKCVSLSTDQCGKNAIIRFTDCITYS